MYAVGAIIFLFVSAKPEPWGRKRQGTMRSTIDARNMSLSYARSIRTDSFVECESSSSIEEHEETPKKFEVSVISEQINDLNKSESVTKSNDDNSK